jgi:hypothetical protein
MGSVAAHPKEFAAAATIFKYFGGQNPEVPTGEPAIDETAVVPNELV